jgi:hypothetical protein
MLSAATVVASGECDKRCTTPAAIPGVRTACRRDEDRQDNTAGNRHEIPAAGVPIPDAIPIVPR